MGYANRFVLLIRLLDAICWSDLVVLIDLMPGCGGFDLSAIVGLGVRLSLFGFCFKFECFDFRWLLLGLGFCLRCLWFLACWF